MKCRRCSSHVGEWEARPENYHTNAYGYEVLCDSCFEEMSPTP